MNSTIAHVKKLLRQWAAGKLTKEAQIELNRAKQQYSEEEWFRMEVEVCCELENELADKPPMDWRPVLEQARKCERRGRSMALPSHAAAWLGGAAALLLVLWLGGRMLSHRPRPLDLGTNCPVWVSDGEIPASEFACTVWWGDSTSITVDRTSRGRVGVIRNVEVWRDADGVLALLPVRYPLLADTTDVPAIRIMTLPYQQCLVRLPDGSEIRLNASSTLQYPLWNVDREVSYAKLIGQAWVRLREKEKTQRPVKLVLETANSQLHTSAGEYTVLATRNETSATLLEGETVMLARGGGEQQQLRIPGDAVKMETRSTTPGGAATIRVSAACVDTREALGWTRMRREYRNVPVREFVADMSRWYGFRVEDMACVPEGPRITATVCYRAPVGEVYAQLYAADVFMVERDGMVSFCGPLMDPLQPAVPVPMPDRNVLVASAGHDNGDTGLK
ncbi:FecR domain-containing protein [Parapedobacter deserti]|uniref:FecR domain-containing protein n=1 Tax=Parapedobacter deserti TaxID=1912957 RepID=A0ABV7JN59_9SPHI